MFTRAELDAAHALVRSTLLGTPAIAWPLLAAPSHGRRHLAGRQVGLLLREGSIDLAVLRSWVPGG